MESALAWEIIGEVLAAVIVAQLDAAGGIWSRRRAPPSARRVVGGEAVPVFADDGRAVRRSNAPR